MSQIDTTEEAPGGDGRLPRFEFLAGRLSLDFCNTHSRATGGDRLCDVAGLAGWAARCGRTIATPPGASDLARFLKLRDRLCHLFDAVVLGSEPAQDDLDALAAAARPATPPRLRWDGAVRRVVPADRTDSCDRLYGDIARDALDLLAGDQVARLKRCPSDACHWFFFDSSRNGKRRWCAMADCGTKAKVRHYRERHRTIENTAF